MRSTRLIQVAIIFGMASASAMAADTFANGQSFYGQPAQQADKARVVDVSTARHLALASSPIFIAPLSKMSLL